MTAPLVVAGVSKAFGRHQVLRDVSLEARAGEILAVVGENGAGKSTLLRIIAGLLRPSAGSVTTNGRLGYCDQDPQLFPDLTVAEHFRYFARAYGIADSGAWTATRDELLERFDFARFAGSRVATLSGGTQHKLHLALALLHLPTVLVLDEPYHAFDWQTYLRFWEHAATLRDRGVAIVVVSHLVHERARFDRVAELRDGVLQ